MGVDESGKAFVLAWIDRHAEAFYPCADALWSFAELGCEETKSSDLLIRVLEKHGFAVERGVAGLPTAFVARWGKGTPVIGLNCEYDSLPGLSQQREFTKRPIVDGAPGHGCGHNLLGIGSIIAALAIKEWLSRSGQEGTVKVLGCPAEEMCIGKPFMARAGCFSGFDAIIDWHPWSHTSANYDTCNAYFNLKYHFRGRTAHGNSPWGGHSALDSGLLMGHAIELLREHIRPGTSEAANTINYTFSDVGPEYPSVVPDRTTVWVVGRITESREMEEVMKRIHRCAEGASIATGTSWEMEFITATHEKIPNRTLASLIYRNLLEIGPPRFDESEQNAAREIQRELGLPEVGLVEEVMEFGGRSSAVSDNAEFSWFAPFAMAWILSAPSGMSWHNWQVAAFAGTSVGRKAMTLASKVLATSTVDLITQPVVLLEARKEFSNRLSSKVYRPLIPEDAPPPVGINRKTMEKYRSLMEAHYEEIA